METPILFIVFNRPETTAKVFAQIRKVRPKRIFIAADGPRQNRLGEDRLCWETRNLITTGIDWQCEVMTLFREENAGCKKAVSEAITWFFEQVEEGIILEDDCLPDLSFFPFCEEMLAHYRGNSNIISINGSNLGFDSICEDSYGYSNYMNMWGWATWKEQALQIDYDLHSWKKNRLKYLYLLYKVRHYKTIDIRWLKLLKDIFDQTAAGLLDTWDFQWIYAQIQKRKMAIFPARNLVKNIGFHSQATHTKDPDHPIACIELGQLTFPLKHPEGYAVDLSFEDAFIKKLWFNHQRRSLYWIIATKLLMLPLINTVYRKIRKPAIIQ